MFRDWFEKQRIPVIITEPHSITQSERIAKFLKAFKENSFKGYLTQLTGRVRKK